MAFIEEETVRKQHKLNSLWGMYTLIAVYVHFDQLSILRKFPHIDTQIIIWLPVGCCESGIPVHTRELVSTFIIN